jgi:hypothetical protein
MNLSNNYYCHLRGMDGLTVSRTGLPHNGGAGGAGGMGAGSGPRAERLMGVGRIVQSSNRYGCLSPHASRLPK